MKRKIIFFMLMGLFVFVGCGNKTSNKNLTTYTTISYNEYVDLMENDITFPLVIGSSTCSACSMYKVTMERFIKKYQIDVKYIDISKLSDDEYRLLKGEVNFSSTPTTIFIEKGKHTSVYDRLVGAEAFSEVVSKFTSMGYID